MKKYSALTSREMSDSGQALVLICIILTLATHGRGWLWAALVALVLNMACPRIFKGFAFVWLNFSHVMGVVVSHIVMAVEFFLLVMPIGLFRRLMGKDSMALKKWRKDRESVFIERNHTFTADDLRNPY